MRFSAFVAVVCSAEIFDSENQTHAAAQRAVKFNAVPRCPETSWLGDVFWDPARRKCVELNRQNIRVPHSAPCPVGSGRREDEFVCRGRIETGYQIKCKNAWNIRPTSNVIKTASNNVKSKGSAPLGTGPTNKRPYYSNEDYQCIQVLTYDQMRQKRCPKGYQLKKLYDRTGFRLQYFQYTCVAKLTRPAHLVTFDPLVVSNCEYVLPEDVPQLSSVDLSTVSDEEIDSEIADDIIMTDLEADLRAYTLLAHDEPLGEHLQGEDAQFHRYINDYMPPLYPTGSVKTYGSGQRGECTVTKTEQLVLCDYRDKLVWNELEERWECVGKVWVTPDPDPTGCRKGFHWSNEFNACLHVEAYAPPRYCPDGVGGLVWKREGGARRYSRGPRYNENPEFVYPDEVSRSEGGDEDSETQLHSSPAFDPPEVFGRYRRQLAPATNATQPPPSGSSSKAQANGTEPFRMQGNFQSYQMLRDRCFIDSALPDTPYCPKGYWLEQYHRDPAPLCIEERLTEPIWDCRGITDMWGTQAELVELNGEQWCVYRFDGRLEVEGPPPLTKRQRKNALALVKKSVMNLPQYEQAADVMETWLLGKDVHNKAKNAWDYAVRAALQLLEPDETFSPYTAPLTSAGFEVAGLASPQSAV